MFKCIQFFKIAFLLLSDSNFIQVINFIYFWYNVHTFLLSLTAWLISITSKVFGHFIFETIYNIIFSTFLQLFINNHSFLVINTVCLLRNRKRIIILLRHEITFLRNQINIIFLIYWIIIILLIIIIII